MSTLQIHEKIPFSGQVSFILPERFRGKTVNIQVSENSLSEQSVSRKKRKLGTLKGKMGVSFAADFKMTDEELCGDELSR
ncbi:hypothetical protein FACS189427_11770 [Planctomycetales bacterium]|nr:hypothetical protein FACS189427_11770 [Planctomycetales bacterium]